MKKCKVCGASKDVTHGSYCSNCRAAYNKEYAARTVNVDYRLQRKYGISLQEYHLFLKIQESKCAICKSDDPKTDAKMFCVDHDHTTGVVRGLLCKTCNSALGLLNEDFKIIQAAAEYVKNEGIKL